MTWKTLQLIVCAALALVGLAGTSAGAAVIGVADAVRPGAALQDARTVTDLGAGCVRVTVSWADVEPVKGKLTFAGTDAIIKALSQAKIGVLITLKCSSPWGTTYPPGKAHVSSAPKSYDDYGKFVKAVVSKYGGSVHVWQIEDEWGGDRWASDRDSFIRTMEVGARAIRQAAPKATVLAGGLASDTILFSAIYDGYIRESVSVSQGRSSVPITRASLARNRRFMSAYKSARTIVTSLRNSVDGLALSLYGRADLLDAEMRWARARLKSSGYPARFPIWVTACGGPEWHYSPVSADANAEEAVKRVVCLVADGAQGVFWDPMLAASPAASADPDLAPMALVDKSGAKKLSFATFQAVASKLAGSTGGERLSASHGVYLYRIDTKRGPLYAAWSRVKVEVKLPLPNGKYTLARFHLAAGGRPETWPATASDGLKVMLTSTPIIVEAR